jgi:hypothetical protein
MLGTSSPSRLSFLQGEGWVRGLKKVNAMIDVSPLILYLYLIQAKKSAD